MLVLEHDYEVLKTEWLVPSKTLLCSIKHTIINEECHDKFDYLAAKQESYKLIVASSH